MPVHPDPWPGESLSYYDAQQTAPTLDTNLWRDVALRSDAGRTMTAGDVWRVWYDADSTWSDRYLDDPTASVVVSWVVEVNSGTGTLAASEGVAASWPDPADPAPTSLGSQTVTGPATVVFDSVTMTAAEVVNSGPMHLVRLECTAGSLDVQQVKLQVWPVAGVGGGWSDVKPSWTTDPQNATIFYSTPNVTGNGEAGSREAAYAAARDDYATKRTALAAPASRNMTTASTGGGLSASQETGVLSPGVYSGTWFMAPILGVAQGVDWRGRFPIDTGTLVEGVDWTRPPTEVPNDPTMLAQQVGTGSTGWFNAVIGFTVPADTLPGDVQLATLAGDYAVDVDPGTGTAFVLPVPAGSAVTTGTYPLVTDGRDLLWVVAHSMPDAYPGGSASASLNPGAGSPIQTFATLPPYRVWVPTAVTATEYPLRLIRRGDGLGMGSGRVLSTGTRQNSTRVFGVL